MIGSRPAETDWAGLAIALPLTLLLSTTLCCAKRPIAPDSEPADPEPPRLVLQITVDQLRGDLPMRFRDRLGRGGFRYLLERGTHFTNAHYAHANTETVTPLTFDITWLVCTLHDLQFVVQPGTCLKEKRHILLSGGYNCQFDSQLNFLETSVD